MIIDKQKLAVKEEEAKVLLLEEPPLTTEEEAYETNALCEVYKAVRKILSEIRVDGKDPSSPLLFRTVKVNNGQLARIKGSKYNHEYGIAFPAALVHFINVHYLVQQSRIGEGRATMRIQYVLNRLNNSDSEYEMEGFEVFQKVNSAIQKRKAEFPALAARCQLKYFDQLESFSDGLQPFWIDYEIWFSEYSSYRYKDYVERYVVIPPFTNHDDQLPENNKDNHENHSEPTIEDAAGFASIQ